MSRLSWLISVILVLILVIMVGSVVNQSVLAQTSTSTPTVEPNPHPTILVTTTDDDLTGCPENCTLRSAITTAKAGDVIGFKDDLMGTLVVADTLTIDKNLTIIAAKANQFSIDGSKLLTIFKITGENVKVELTGLTLQNGIVGVEVDGFSDTDVTMTDSIITGSIDHGITIASGVLTLNNCAITSNQVGGIFSGGGIVTMVNSTIADNSNYGIESKSTLTVTNSAIYGNLRAGIVTSDIATVNNSTISDNQGNGIISNHSLTLSNSTVFGNQNSGLEISGAAIVSNSTIVSNVANVGGGIHVNNSAEVTLLSSIVASNSASQGPDIAGKIKSLGHNLVGNNANMIGLFASDQKNVDPRLAPPTLNLPGITLTITLLPDSPAIGKGQCTGALSVTTDQRGVNRKIPCDVGAFEYDPANPAVPTATNTPTNTPTLTSTPTQTPMPTYTPTPLPPSPTPIPTLMFTEGTVISLESVNLRSGPGPNFAVITALRPGTIVNVRGVDADHTYYFVLLNDGTTGWIRAERLNVPDAARLPIMDAVAAQTQVALPPPAPTGLLPYHDPSATDVLAYCDSANRPHQTFSAGSNISIWWSWYAKTQDQIQSHLANAQYDVKVDGQPIENWQSLHTGIIRQQNNYYVYWFVPLSGNLLSVGEHKIDYKLTWLAKITDGEADYGPGTRNEIDAGTCGYMIN